jgi:hypothetical protein
MFGIRSTRAFGQMAGYSIRIKAVIHCASLFFRKGGVEGDEKGPEKRERRDVRRDGRVEGGKEW